ALLIRRHRYTGQMSFYRCWSPHPVPLARLIHVATSRWRIEEDHQLAKQTCGLDAGQVIRWRSWHRWSTMALLAYAFIAVATAYQRQLDGPLAEHLGLVAIAIPELLRQLRGVVIPDPRRDPEHRLTWSHLAATAPISSAPLPPAMAYLRRDNTMITTIYGCRNRERVDWQLGVVAPGGR